MDIITTTKYMKDVIKNYINNRMEQKRIAHNMQWLRKHNMVDTCEEAFMFEMQSATSVYTELSIDEQEKVAGSVWYLLKNKNHSLTRLW